MQRRSKTLLISALTMAFAILTGAGCGQATQEDASTSDDSVDSIETGDFGNTSNSEEGNQELPLGVSFKAEGVAHTVNHVIDHWYNPYDEYRFESADEGMKMIAINLTVENTGTEVADTSNLYYLLEFGEGEPAEMSFYGGGVQGVDTNLNRFPADNPLEVGATSTGDLLFEVPEDTTLEDWTLIYDSDFLEFEEDNEVVETPLAAT